MTSPTDREAYFKDQLKTAVEVFKDIDVRIEQMRNNLKKSFFNSIMSSRELIRNSGFIQLKI